MKALVVYCHPVGDSFCASMRDAAVSGLLQAGHHVDVLDLAHENFNPVMSHTEWHTYRDRTGEVSSDLQQHINLVKEANILVFVYPTWWSSMPAQLKGWLERVMLQDVAFRFNENNKIRPALTQVRRTYVLTTFGSPRWYVWVINNNGRRVFARALRASTGLGRFRSLVLYSMDTQTQENRQKFLRDITRKLSDS